MKTIIHYISFFVVITIIMVIGLDTHLVNEEFAKIEMEISSNFRYIHISDLHNKLSFMNGKISSIINSHKPDFVVATGDYSNTQKNLCNVIEELGNIRCPVFMVLGNYERQEKMNLFKKKEISLDLLKSEVSHYRNLKLLVNEEYLLNIENTEILIYGFDNSTYGNEIFKDEINDIKSDCKIILAHSPNIIDIIKEKEIAYNHILVGHTHGKQINIPLLIKTEYDKFHIGLKKINKNHYFSISRGLGTARIPMRINSMPVINIYDIVQE